LIITGDLNQTDLKGENGLHDIVSRLERKPMDKIRCIHLDKEDIARSEIVKQVMELYEEETNNTPINNTPTNNTPINNTPINNTPTNSKKISIPTWRKLSRDLHID